MGVTITTASAATYTPIATITAPGGTNTVNFTSIPNTYTDLILIANYNLNSEGLFFRLNGDTGSNYSNTYMIGTGSSALSGRASNATLGVLGPRNVNQNGRSATIVQFMNYSNTTTYKTVLDRYNMATQEVGAIVNLWRNTSAINAIELSSYNSSWNFSSGDTFTLYGILAA